MERDYARTVANGYAKYLKVQFRKEVQNIEASIDDTLLRLEEFSSSLDMVRKTSDREMSSSLLGKKKELNSLFEKIDKLEYFVSLVKKDIEKIEELVHRAEMEFGFSTEGKILNLLRPLFNYRLTEEEARVIRDCEADSFYQRCLPLSTLLGFATYHGVKTGALRPNRQYGAMPKVTAAVFLGYILGKISYSNKCAEKLMSLPNSELGDLLRRQRSGWFSKEELRVLQECNRESFYQRCLPLSTTLGIGTYLAVKSGVFQPHPRFGAAPKVAAAVALGFIAGKVSYQRRCAEKLMALPNSRFGAALRNVGPASKDTVTLDPPSEYEKLYKDIPDSQKYSDIPVSSGMDLDTDRPLPGIDESYRPIGDDYLLEDDNTALLPPSGPAGTTYDDLRRRNREEYEQKRTKPYRGVVPPEDVPTGLRPPRDDPLSPQIPRSSNMYGDFWEK